MRILLALHNYSERRNFTSSALWHLTHLRSTLQGFLELDHTSPKRHLQSTKLQCESLSCKAKFKAGLSKDKTCHCIHSPVRVSGEDEDWTLGEEAVYLGIYMSKLATVLWHMWVSRWENSVLNEIMLSLNCEKTLRSIQLDFKYHFSGRPDMRHSLTAVANEQMKVLSLSIFSNSTILSTAISKQ